MTPAVIKVEGTSYLGVLSVEGGATGIVDAMEVTGKLSNAVLKDYVMMRNLKALGTVVLSANQGHSTCPLTDNQKLAFAHLEGELELVKASAIARLENSIFSNTFAG